MPDGVWYELRDGTVAFHALPPPTDEDVTTLTEHIVGASRGGPGRRRGRIRSSRAR